MYRITSLDNIHKPKKRKNLYTAQGPLIDFFASRLIERFSSTAISAKDHRNTAAIILL